MPHCDTINGPVVLSAKKAIETGNINYVLIWVPQSAEEEMKSAFAKTLAAGKYGKEAKDVADYWFYETAVRLHRAGEGEGFAGIKSEAHADPIIQKAEQSIKDGDAHDFIEQLEDSVEETLEERFKNALKAKDYDVNDVEAGRKYIETYIEFVVFAHHLYEGLKSKHSLDQKSHHEH